MQFIKNISDDYSVHLHVLKYQQQQQQKSNSFRSRIV